MSTQTDAIDQISWRSTASLLVRAFLCSLICSMGLFMGLFAFYSAALAGNSGGILFHRGSGNYFWTVLFAVLAILLFGASLFLFKIRPENGQRRLRDVIYVILGAVILWVSYYGNITRTDPLYLGIIIIVSGAWVALMVYLLASKQITVWQDWVGSLGALLVGIGLNVTGFYHVADWPIFFIPPIWLSMAFFPELLRFRAGWKGAVVGFMLWVVLGLLSFWIIGTLG
jgi:hypothetical protein